MMYGVYCPPGTGGGGGGYPGALAAADFINDVYQVAEVDVDVATVIDNPSMIDPSGLGINWNNPNTIRYLLGDFLAVALAVEWTMVIEWSMAENFDMQIMGIGQAGGSGDLLFIDNHTPDPSGFDDVEVTDDSAGSSVERIAGVNALPFSTTPIRKIAFTRTTDRLSLSLGGGAVNSDGTDVVAFSGADTATLGNYSFPITDPDQYASMNGHIRKIIIYPVALDADLPSMSA